MSLPRHVGFILDGNRRWAKAKGLDSLEGHRAGYENLKTIGKYANKIGIKYITAYTFSTENWKRSPREVGYLMDLIERVLLDDLDELHGEGIRIRISGHKDKFRPSIRRAMERAESHTAKNKKSTLILALNYGGRTEIVDAFNKINKRKVTERDIARNLYLPDVPDPDLIIRTSGENRLSGFLTWESVYSELYFTPVHWPDFTPPRFRAALKEYERRGRRFGK